jgi:hypothetical protein
MLRGERAPDGRKKNSVRTRQIEEDAQLRRMCIPIRNLYLVINQRGKDDVGRRGGITYASFGAGCMVTN